MPMNSLPYPPKPREAIIDLEASRIRQIANAGMGRTDIAAFWFGESDLPTPEFIRQAAIASLADGETFYTQNLGRPKLRAAIARYLNGLHGAAIEVDRVAVTGSGVAGLMLSAQMLLSPGDRVVIITPVWPNIAEIPRILGADVVRVGLTVANGRWELDLEQLIDALTPQTRALYLGSPNNPTGWTIDTEALAMVFAHCRRLGIWLVTDDVYERLCFRPGQAVAPSLLAEADPGDRLISVNSFSKTWRMTGWRVGWMTAPSAIIAELGKVIEYNSSCVPDFVQQGALAALEDVAGEQEVASLRADLATARNHLVAGLRRHQRIEIPEADGAMYAFFRIDGEPDSMRVAEALISTVGLGLAPGRAFGAEGEGWLRWCFAARPEKLTDGLDRLARFLDDRRAG